MEAAEIEGTRKSWTLVPTQRHVEACALRGKSAVTLRRLVRELSAAEQPAAAPTTPEMTRLLTAELTGTSIRHARGLDDTLGRLRRAGTTAAALRSTGLERGEKLAQLVTAFDDKLEQRALRDERLGAWAAARHLRHAPPSSKRSPAGDALVQGLVRWDNSTLSFLEALHEQLRGHGEGVCIELPTFHEGPLREAAEALSAELEGRWATWNHAPQLTFVPVSPFSSSRTSCVEAYDASSEARAVARSVVEGLARGLAVDRIAIVAAELTEAFLEPLRFELSHAGVPFVEPRGRPALAAPRAHAALELLRLARGPLSRDALIDVLRVPELHLGRWFGSDPLLVSELLHELGSLPLRFDRSGSELSLELRDRLSELMRLYPERAERLAEPASRLQVWLDELKSMGEPATRQAHAQRAIALFQELALLEVSNATLAQALARAARGRPELLHGLGHDALGGRAVATSLERTVAAARAVGIEEGTVELGHYLDEIELALEGVAEPRGAARAGALVIARPDEAAGLPWDLAILCRASDASLDRASSPSMIGTELEGRLPKAERPQHPRIEQHFTLFAVGAALMRAREVVVTWARHDEGSTLAPSRFAAALRAGVPFRQEPPSPLSPRARRARAARAPSFGASLRAEVERRHLAFYADPSVVADAFNGEVGSIAHFVGASDERPLAITAVERSLRCGFLGFTSSVLRATRGEALEDAISARERGTLLHAALAAALEAIRDAPGSVSRSELERLGLEAARGVLASKGRSSLRRAGLRTTLSDVAALLSRILDEDHPAAFLSAEQGFGAGAPWPALALGPWRFSGRVDRIDATTDRRLVRVIDYKTRSPTRADADQALQPWLYALKVGEELGAEQVEFAYLALNRRAPKLTVIYAGSPRSEAIQQAAERAELAAEALSSGHVPPRPMSSASCARCEARDLCRRPLSAPEGTEDER